MINKGRHTFHKMHGLGNDFMLLDVRKTHFSPSAQQVQQWANRHQGVGFDQLILIKNENDQLHYRFFNADGSEAEQCGNGQRCIGLFLRKQMHIELPLNIYGPGGPVLLAYESNGYSATFVLSENIETIEHWPEESDRCVYVDMGNPHLVLTRPDPNTIDLNSLNQQVISRFPQGINIEVISKRSDTMLNMRVWERGTGETMACGSGACAAVIAASHLFDMSHNVEVAMPGGQVMVKYVRSSGQVSLTGPASYVFTGKIDTTE